jgi:D-alanyl-lipoteichoic acid acyltransferase DltB (MBOAT superfamily)
MLFNSDPFLLGFLPAVLAVHLALRGRRNATALWLIIASLVFYSWWDWRYIGLLLASAAANYLIGGRIAAHQSAARAWLAAGIALDLTVLGLFKYLAFFAGIAGWRLGGSIVLPLGISFYTFTQIAFLIDLARTGERPPGARDYLLFVTWFPHLIAGPILHHRDMIPQFTSAGAFRASLDDLAAGATMLCLGLGKKVLLADMLAPYVTPIFDQAGSPALLPAWIAAFAYSLELYFDFSGYCDMAIGLSLLFGIRLPANFASPYQAASIIEFWRRWHMTLARFLRDDLYIPLGGNRSGLGRYGNILITMALGGLWHGAGWTYLVWGLVHGAYLCINHLARARRLALPRGLTHAVTLLAVILAWVPFRAPDLGRAGTILVGLVGVNGLGQLDGDALGAVSLIGVLGMVVLAAPNTQTMLAAARPTLTAIENPERTRFAWRLSAGWAAAAGFVLAASLVRIGQASPFLYFEF